MERNRWRATLGTVTFRADDLVLMCATLLVVVLYSFGWGPDGPSGPPTFAYEGREWLLPIGGVLALGLLRRSLPWTTLALVLALEFEGRRADISAEPFTAALALFSIADRRGWREGAAALVLSWAVLEASTQLAGRSRSGFVLGLVAYWLGAALGLRNRRNRERARRIEQLEQRTRAQYEALLLAERDRVAAQRRAAIAAEVHDVLTNSACLTARLADAAVAATDVGKTVDARTAMAQTGRISRAALHDIRSLLQTIRDDDVADELAGDPRVDASMRIEDVVDGLRWTGIAVDFASSGAPVDRWAEALVVRVLREAIANLLKHADATTVTIRIAHAVEATGRAGDTVITVENDGVRDVPSPGGSGLGLPGLRALVRRYGGTFDAHADEQRKVWTLSAAFPHRETKRTP